MCHLQPGPDVDHSLNQRGRWCGCRADHHSCRTGRPPIASADDRLPQQPAIDETTRSKLPAGGRWIATRTDRTVGENTFLLYELTPSGLREHLRESPTTVSAFGWLDAQRLVVYREELTGDATVTQIVDSADGPATKVPASIWTPEQRARPGTLALFASGEIWVVHCAKARDPDDALSRCLARVGTKLGGGTLTVETKVPTKRALAVADRDAPMFGPLAVDSLPMVEPPTNHSLKLFTLKKSERQNYKTTYEKGWMCKSPDGTSMWPFGNDWIERLNMFEFRPRRVQWVSAQPPRYVVEGDAKWIDKTDRWTVLMRACHDEPIRSGAYLGDSLWGEMTPAFDTSGCDPIRGCTDERASGWQLFAGPTHVATLLGSARWFAAQPR